MVGELGERVLQPRRAQRERLEPLVARRQQASDRLVTRQQRDDAFLLGTAVGARGAPDLAGDLAHQAGGLLLDRRQPVVEPLVHATLDG